MVGLPSKLHVSSEDDAMRLRSHVRDKYGVEVPIYYRAPKNGESETESEPRDEHGLITGYARISHQVYNRIEDYYKFRDAINRIILEETSLQGCF